MATWFWLTRPRKLFSRIRYGLWEWANPDKPWLCPGTTKFCEGHLSKSMRAVEFGSGRSTLWFATRVGRLTSVEHNPEWYRRVKQRLADAEATNVDYRLVPLNHPYSEPELREYSPLPDYVAVADEFADATVDFAIVDGHYRNHCVKRLIPKIAPGGYLLVDDVDFWSSPGDLPIPSTWRVVDDSSNGIKRCIVWEAAGPIRNLSLEDASGAVLSERWT